MLGIGARQLNELVVAELGATPARIARDHGRAIAGSATSRSTTASPPASPLRLMLDARPPYDPAVTLEFLAQRAVPGIEHAEDGRYRGRCHYRTDTALPRSSRRGPRPASTWS
ncbi:MAG: AlkA N-terminal domain-containing protein [Ilumatobacteraceae bacterium]